MCLMRWLFLLLVAYAGTGVLIPSATFAESTNTVKIESISHAVGPEDKESVTFKLDSNAEPKVFPIKGENPRLVIDFPGSIYLGKNVIPLADGKLATTIRIGLHQTPGPKTRIVVDLAKDVEIQYTRDYSEADHTLVVVLSPDSVVQPQKVATLEPESQPKPSSPIILPKEEITAAVVKPVEEKPMPAASSSKEIPGKPELEKKAEKPKTVKAITPQLLEISFDDSSNRGEMVLFHLNDFYPPTVSALEKGRPRVQCDFMEMGLGDAVQENIFANGKYVERIRTTKHKTPDKVQVILDLAPDRDYDLQQVFFKNDNLFVLIVNELSPEMTGKSN